MRIDTKIGLGDNFYVIGKRTKNEIRTCAGCRGDGKVSLYDRTIFDCPKCGGDGLIETPIFGPDWELKAPHWQGCDPPDVFAHKAVFIQTNTMYHHDSGKNETRVRYDHVRGGGIFDESVCFPTLEAAQSEINRLNGMSENENNSRTI